MEVCFISDEFFFVFKKIRKKHKVTRCCLPYNVNETLDLFIDESGDVDDCGVPECASSYLEEVAFAFDHGDDPILGCTSGIEVFDLSLFLSFSISF